MSDTQDHCECLLMNVLVLASPQHGIGSDQCRAGQGRLVCTSGKTGSGSGDVLGVVGGTHISPHSLVVF